MNQRLSQLFTLAIAKVGPWKCAERAQADLPFLA